MDTTKSIIIAILGLFVIAFIIVFISGEVRNKNQSFLTVAKWTLGLALAIPVLAVIVN